MSATGALVMTESFDDAEVMRILACGNVRCTLPSQAMPHEDDLHNLSGRRSHLPSDQRGTMIGKLRPPCRPVGAAVALRILREAVERVMLLYGVQRIRAVAMLAREGHTRAWDLHQILCCRRFYTPEMRWRMLDAMDRLEAQWRRNSRKST